MHRTLGHRSARVALIAIVAIAGALLVSGWIARSPVAETPPSEALVAERAGTQPPESGTASISAEAPMETAPATEASAAPSSLHGAAGMVVGIDPETGRPGMPTREQRAAIERSGALAAPALDRSSEGLAVVHKPDGSMSVDLRDRFQDYTVVRITPDGRKEQSCVQGAELEEALRGDAERSAER